jgi:hypothetical protein
LRGAPSALACDQLVAIVDSTNNERLDDTARNNGAGQLFEGFFSKARSGLVRTWVDQVYVDVK